MIAVEAVRIPAASEAIERSLKSPFQIGLVSWELEVVEVGRPATRSDSDAVPASGNCRNRALLVNGLLVGSQFGRSKQS